MSELSKKVHAALQSARLKKVDVSEYGVEVRPSDLEQIGDEKFPVASIPFDQLAASQEQVDEAKVRAFARMGLEWLEQHPGLVEREGDKFQIRDGHHRILALKLLGARDAAAFVKADKPKVDFSQVAITVRSDLEDIFKEAADEFMDSIGRDALVDVDELAANWARERAAELVTELEDTTRDRLRQEVVDALEQGRSTSELAAELEDEFDFSESRAEMIARTELAMAQGAGGMQAARDSGVATGKKWILGSEHGVEDVCDDNAEAGVIDIDDEFPSGDDAAPAHPHCVCDVVIVVEGDQDEEAA